MSRQYSLWVRTQCSTPVWDTGEVAAAGVSGFCHKYKTPPAAGRFTKGTFRVLPYSVESIEYGSAVPDTLVTSTYREMGYNCKRTWKGPLALTVPFTWEYVTFPSDYASLQKTAVQAAFAKLGSKKLGGGENLGELKETLAMLRSPFKSLRDFVLGSPKRFIKDKETFLDFLRTFGKKTKRHSSATLKTASDTWLEYRYGLMPLLYTIEDIMKLVEAELDKYDPRRIYTVRSKRKTTVRRVFDFGYSPLFEFKFTRRMVVDTAVRATGIVYFRQLKPLPTLPKLGLGLRNLPETAWELTRLSFVIDWILSIGPWLESLRFNPEIEILGSSVSTRISVSGETDCTVGQGIDGWKVESSSVLQASLKADIFERQLLDTTPPALPQLQGSDALNLLRTLDGLALLTQPLLKALRKI